MRVERELMILDKLINEPKEYSFYEIMEKSDLSREPTYRHLQRLVDKNLVTKRRIGNIYLYSINFRNELIHPLLSFLHIKRLTDEEKNAAKSIISLLPASTLFAFMKQGKDGSTVVYVVYAGKPENMGELLNRSDTFAGLNIRYRGMEIKNFRRLVLTRGLKALRNTKAFFNGERMFKEVANVLAEDEEE